jgi:hypothetical protein
MTMPPASPIFQELVDLRTAFADTRDLLAKGERVDLTGMDDRVRDFCDRVAATDAATRSSIEPDFAALLALLGDLETELRRARDHAKFTLDPANPTSGLADLGLAAAQDIKPHEQ